MKSNFHINTRELDETFTTREGSRGKCLNASHLRERILPEKNRRFGADLPLAFSVLWGYTVINVVLTLAAGPERYRDIRTVPFHGSSADRQLCDRKNIGGR